MNDFHYNHMKMRYPEEDQLKLLFTDTDSLAYAIKTDDVYAEMLDDNHLFDFSGYQDEHPCFSNMSLLDEVKCIKQQNKKKVNRKEELDSMPLKEFGSWKLQ